MTDRHQMRPVSRCSGKHCMVHGTALKLDKRKLKRFKDEIRIDNTANTTLFWKDIYVERFLNTVHNRFPQVNL